jgi:hypothetical protein
MIEQETARKIRTYLDRDAASLKSETLYRLQRARQAALARLDEPKRANAFAFAGSGGMLSPRRAWADLRIWLGILLIVGGVTSYTYWQTVQQTRDLEETDAAILSSELPIEAYLDRGFQAWLKHSEP